MTWRVGAAVAIAALAAGCGQHPVVKDRATPSHTYISMRNLLVVNHNRSAPVVLDFSGADFVYLDEISIETNPRHGKDAAAVLIIPPRKCLRLPCLKVNSVHIEGCGSGVGFFASSGPVAICVGEDWVVPGTQETARKYESARQKDLKP